MLSYSHGARVSFLYHWAYRDLWVPVWPNYFATVSVGVVAGLYARAKAIQWHKEQISRHRDHMASLNELHDKVDLLSKKK